MFSSSALVYLLDSVEYNAVSYYVTKRLVSKRDDLSDTLNKVFSNWEEN